MRIVLCPDRLDFGDWIQAESPSGAVQEALLQSQSTMLLESCLRWQDLTPCC
jgi:hypothetical protein